MPKLKSKSTQSDQAKELPVVVYDDEELKGLHQQVESLKTAIEEKRPADSLVLTADDINAMIAQEEELRGKVFVRIDEGQVSGDLSIPLDEFPGMSGRYFNGSITMNVSLQDGVLVVTVDDASVNGESVPEQFMQGLRKQNLAAEAYKNTDAVKVLQRIERLEISGDTIVLTPKSTDDIESMDDTGSGDTGSGDNGAGGDAESPDGTQTNEAAEAELDAFQPIEP